MAHSAGSISSRSGLLPASLALVLRRRLGELCGLALFAAATTAALALVSYRASDPSFNAATDQPVRNLVGLVGAHGADLALQWLGLAAALVPVILGAWGWRCFSHRGLPYLWLNLLLAPLALVLAAATAAGFPRPVDWPFGSGLGGVAGDLLGQHTASLGQGLGLAGPAGVVVLGLLALLLLVPAMGLALGEWAALGRMMRRTAGFAAWAGGSLGRRLGLAGSRLPRLQFGRRAGSADEPPASGRRRRERVAPELVPAGHTEPPAAVATPAKRRVAAAPVAARPSKRAVAEDQAALDLGGGGDGYQLPPLGLLQKPKQTVAKVDEEALEANARLLESVLDDFGVRGQITKVRPGPVVTLYELEPAPGTKSSRVIGLADDIARSMSAISARVSVVPGRNAMGIELPNPRREIVFLAELLSAQDYEKTSATLTLALGKDIAGAPVVADLARMPHLLVAGTTGSGKSVAINTMILSLLYRLPPDQCKLILIDPKMLELSVYEGIPHLLAPVVTEPGKAVVALKWTVREMEDRYRKMSRLGVRNIAGYNARIAEARNRGEELKRSVQTGFDVATGKPVFEEQALPLEPLPFIVVVVDEFADLMMVAGKDIEGAIQRLAQMARAAGIHLILATQRPSVDVITGTIKANFPTRISFQVTSKIDSRTILGEQGAEQLLGQGDMLYMAGGGRVTRVHGPFCSDGEVEAVVAFLKAQGTPAYLDAVTEELDEVDLAEGGFGGGGGSGDDLYDKAVALVAREGKASTSFIQRHLQIGYNRAARIIEQMEDAGIVGKPNHVGKREVLINEAGERIL